MQATECSSRSASSGRCETQRQTRGKEQTKLQAKPRGKNNVQITSRGSGTSCSSGSVRPRHPGKLRRWQGKLEPLPVSGEGSRGTA